MHCQAALDEADQVLHGRYDKIDHADQRRDRHCQGDTLGYGH